ncbi:MAG: sigma-70 family RNA polymerase sigma factor [Gammaproteobacteria bacterium]|jgi:RNA polymerase primary sigma factor|nr:sigma-70 family RNA polymerase sigma factor [Gammaproteobacteria bacterium]MBT4606196.1 sigma-70 family RNA polymerase sigma factor [Thiotrichales bacterium]MBT3472309.1 sigma-70 family RNA polymerase sigma factor [Gammaproteobacteria bacterium]MBT3967856.1 sigma-70 family RNA polymerase sigma factor [Gammaproteobacteria bacterium]MBT4081761.1 sigma-70 family RNA polymerase sigma factor [Gammaproteobacteria bacterium]
MADDPLHDELSECAFAPGSLSPRHQDVLETSPLLREHCAAHLLTREEEQALFRQISTEHREIQARMVWIAPVRTAVMSLIDARVEELDSPERLAAQLRGLASSGLLENPLSTDEYLEFIGMQMIGHLQKLNSSSDAGEQIKLLAEIIVHPTLRREIDESYQQAYEEIIEKSEKVLANHARIKQLQSSVGALKDKLVKHNLRLIIKHAAVYAKHHIDIQDLIQEGTLGLMRACDLYDFRRGYKFSTYASKWILQSILNLLNEINFTIHVPRNISQTYRNVNQYIDEAVKQSGVAPTAAEISKALELNEKDVNTALRSTWVVSSLNTPVDSSAADSHEVMDLVKDEEDAYEKVDLFLQYRMVRQLIEKIPSERDRDILKRRYAIGYGESTLVDIAKVYGLTKERIRQIINGCIKNMRQELEGDEG